MFGRVVVLFSIPLVIIPIIHTYINVYYAVLMYMYVPIYIYIICVYIYLFIYSFIFLSCVLKHNIIKKYMPTCVTPV